MSLRELLGGDALLAERCVRCGFCNSVCPTSLVRSAYRPSRTSRGRIVLVQSALEGHLDDVFDEELAELMDLCFGCNRCVKVCPAGIPIPDVVRGYRHAYHRAVGVRREEALVLGYHRYAPLLSRLPRSLLRALTKRPSRVLLEWAIGTSRDAPLPLPEGGSLDDLLRGLPRDRGAVRLALFADTFYRYVRPSSALRVVELLSRKGVSVSLPPQRDSGVLLYEHGFLEELKEVAAVNARSLAERVRDGERVLTCSPASTMMLRSVYPKVLGTREAELVAENVVDVNELLLELAESRPGSLAPRAEEVVLHSSCLSQFLGLTEKIARTLRVTGASVREVRGECCGMGGVWGMFARNRADSVELCRRLTAGIRQPLVTYSETCYLQIKSVHTGAVLQSFEAFR